MAKRKGGHKKKRGHRAKRLKSVAAIRRRVRKLVRRLHRV